MRTIGHFIGGKEVSGNSGRMGDVFDPNTGEVQASVALASKADTEQAIANAAAAQPAWAATNPQRRRRVMFKFLELLQRGVRQSRASCCRPSTARRFPTPKGDIQRGLEVVEFACGIPHLAEGRVQRRRRSKHRSLFRAPAARRRCGHHAIQLPSDDPAVEMRAGALPAAMRSF